MIPEPTRLTVRDQIMDSLVEIFEKDTSPDRVNWGLVSRKPFSANSLGTVDTALGIYDTSERVREGAGFEYRNVNTIFEFHLYLAEEDDPSKFLNHALGSITNRIGEDLTLGGLAMNARETGSELDIDGSFEKYVSGIIIFDVGYRCKPNDPYTRL